MTAVSTGVLTGYGILHLVFVLALDTCIRKIRGEDVFYRRMRWIWILPYLAAAGIPAAVVFMRESAWSLRLERFGNVFLAFDLHCIGLFFLGSLVYWLIRLVRYRQTDTRLPLPGLLIVFIAGMLVTVCGMYHAQQTVITRYEADLRTEGKEEKQLRIALTADFHLNVNSHPEMMERMVSLLNEQQPDLVVVAGDVFTSSYQALRDPEKYAEILRGIDAPMGVYAVYGNHDVEEILFGGFAVRPVSAAFRTAQIEEFFRDCGFTVLCDEEVLLADGQIHLAGRIDGNKAGDGTRNRLSPQELLKDIPREELTFVLEHEPVQYQELQEAGADLVMSGHTHDGQVFPGNLYIRWINENGYGQKNLYGMETFVTSGVGTFGPPMRTGTNSEIMIIDVRYS